MEPTPGRQWSKTPKTYNTGDSLVVTDPTTDPALASLTRGERTGSRVFWQVWSYVIDLAASCGILGGCFQARDVCEFNSLPFVVPDERY